ncbi:BLUF domain protein [Kalmanozyma brasiliensis GHG001]|uniref:BLUF domain-containing protein n=1 Tax=Kalmanozyma brasiliensis (strain GHG001) TaxID=1365824 RepID=V5F2W7_KALBG|nr:BLUF domain protein [Kalmanozyma brasiliensis GHG001]EST09814.1 BLUF domain protein [Kalmanozyma brasiliensis GHG001]
MLHQRTPSQTSIGPFNTPRPTVHLEHPPSIPRSPIRSTDPMQSEFSSALPPARPPASFTRSASSRSNPALTPAKRPSSGHSSRQSSSDSIGSVSTASSFARAESSDSTASSFGSSSAEEEDLIQVVYTSSAKSRHMPLDEVKQILRASRSNNTALGITGLLLYRDGSFAQFLEGPADAVDSLYDKIERDSRHHGVIRVLRQPVAKRDFRQWSMAFRDLDMVRKHRSHDSDCVGDEMAPEEHVNEGFSQLMNVGLRVGDSSDGDYRPDAYGNAKLDLPADMSASMRKLVVTFYRLMDRPL